MSVNMSVNMSVTYMCFSVIGFSVAIILIIIGLGQEFPKIRGIPYFIASFCSLLAGQLFLIIYYLSRLVEKK